MTYRMFAARIWQLCRALQDLGLRREDRLAILHENCHVFLEVYFAAAHLGLILVPLNHRLAPQELAVILNDCVAHTLINKLFLYWWLFPLAFYRTLPW